MADSLVWVDVPCPLCGARRDDPLLMVPTREGTCRLARCGDCGMVYLNPRPSDDSLALLYPDDYEPYLDLGGDRNGVLTRLVRSVRRLALSRYHGYPPELAGGLERALAPVGKALLDWQGESLTHIPWVGAGRLLDFGCGSGWFAARLRDLGWRVTVMDFNAESVRRAAQRYGLPGLAGSLPHPGIRPESFDVVTMGQVLEHVPNPDQVIEAAARALAPGGLLVVSVPCLASWGFHTFGADWCGLELPRHLLHFTPATLRRLLQRHGLVIQECRTVARGSWLRRSAQNVRARPGVQPLKRLLCRFAAWSPVCRLIGRWSAETRQGDTLKTIAVKPARQALARAA
jgi:2-polyprenyl-3-methyl-5-hydroxy-6-metoxy-1,4-benzoquinol methylase